MIDVTIEAKIACYRYPQENCSGPRSTTTHTRGGHKTAQRQQTILKEFFPPSMCNDLLFLKLFQLQNTTQLTNKLLRHRKNKNAIPPFG